MRYLVKCELGSPFRGYYQELVNDLSNRFSLYKVKLENSPAHFTIKYWFDKKSLSQVEQELDRFCQNHKKLSLKLGGFGSYPPSLIFINVHLSELAKTSITDLMNSLRKIPGLDWDRYDSDTLQFHSTIISGCDKQYDEIMRYLKGKEKYFDTCINNLTIIRELGRSENNVLEWEYHKTFHLGL